MYTFFWIDFAGKGKNTKFMGNYEISHSRKEWLYGTE